MLNKLTLTVLIVMFWLLLSGHYTPLFLFFMAFSTAVVLLLSKRMQADNFEINPFLRVPQILRFSLWYLLEIFKSNISVAQSVWGFKAIKPAMREVKYTQKTSAGAALFANAITLTPGTLSIEIDEQQQTILVHALNPDMLDDLDEGAMDKGITQLEHQ